MAQPPTNPYYQEQHPPVATYPQPPPYSASQPDPSKGAYYQPPPPQYPQQTQQPVQSVTYVRKGPAPPAQKKRRPQTELESSLGGLFKSLERGASHVVNATEKSINRSLDHHTTSPTLAKFGSGNVISLISKNTRQHLRVLPNGAIDALGQPNDPACHFSTWNQGLNVVILRSMANPAFYLSVIQGLTVGLGTGNNNSKFRIHEKPDHHVTFEWVPKNGNYIRIHSLGQPAATIGDNKTADTEFWVNLLSGAQVMQK